MKSYYHRFCRWQQEALSLLTTSEAENLNYEVRAIASTTGTTGTNKQHSVITILKTQDYEH